MTLLGWSAVVLSGLAAALALAPAARWPALRKSANSSGAQEQEPANGLRRHRLLLAGVAGTGGLVFVGPPVGWVVGTVLAGITWVAAGRVEPASIRHAREQARRDLPHVVHLLSLALSAGGSVQGALRLVEEALPGSAGFLHDARIRLDLGLDPEVVWDEVADRPALAPLGRALARAHRVGASPASALAQLAEDLDEEFRGEVEERARAVGIRAAVPLGLCLLPAFLLIGIAPLVVSALSAWRW